MTEYTDKSNEELASAFIVSTCELIPKSVIVVSDRMHDLNVSSSPTASEYSILCGSQAEFYIRPLNTCITDFDFLISSAGELAFIDDFPVLPSDTSGLFESIECHKIESYQRYPGFVRLRSLGEIKYNWEHKKYELYKTNITNSYLELVCLYCPCTIHSCRKLSDIVGGPAFKCVPGADEMGYDEVHSVWCPQWPREAQNWPIRPRYYGWPTIATISEVLQNGCHVVHAQHRSCRDDNRQWRISFSVADVILLQSWTQIQQIVYHLLRFFSKRELIQKDCPKEDEVLCTYHIKTLMLWTCEEMSPEWWNSSSVLAICSKLLKKLSEWLNRRHCPNYFIPEANLFHEPSNSTVLDKIKRQLNVFGDSSVLCHWFVDNYILLFIRTYINVGRTLEVAPHFFHFMLPLLEFRKAFEPKSVDLLVSLRFTISHYNYRFAIEHNLIGGLRFSLKAEYVTLTRDSYLYSIYRMPNFTKAENVLCLNHYAILLHILHTAYGLGCGEISWDSSLFVELVKAISKQSENVRSMYHNFPKTYTAQSSRFQFLRAQDLMQNLTGSNSSSEFQLLSLMSKEFLRKALEYDGSKSGGIAPAALAYLAALHFAASEYQEAIHFCLSIRVVQTSQMEKETLNAGCLLFIDDVARIVGLYVLHKKITDKNLHCIGRRLDLDLRLTPEVFAYYLAALSAERKSKRIDFDYDMPNSAFPMDEFLKASRNPKCIVWMKSGTHFKAVGQIVYRRTHSLTANEATAVDRLIAKETVINVMMEIALENMASFYNMVSKDLGIQCNTVDCYRSLYLYKCRQYDEVLNLCEIILHEPDLESRLKEFAFTNVLIFSPLLLFFDRDVQSLLGFYTLFYFLSHLNDNKLTTDSTLAHFFANNLRNDGFSRLVVLMEDYSSKCHYFLGRHFLARYLKVRCCIDCNLPYGKALTEFAVRKTNLPFEQVIRRFLLQKLRIIKK